MVAEILLLLAFLAFLGLFSWLFAIDFLIIGINTVILYLIMLKARADLMKREMYKEYGIALAVSVAFLLLLGNFLPLWWITTVSVLAALGVQTYVFYKNRELKL